MLVCCSNLSEPGAQIQIISSVSFLAVSLDEAHIETMSTSRVGGQNVIFFDHSSP